MHKKTAKFIKWFPRTLAILFILFLSIFSFDVFGEYEFPEVLVALFMHLIPSIVLLIVLVLSWKKPLWGGSLLIALWLFVLVFGVFRANNVGFLITSLPILFLGGLFLIDSKYGK